MATGQQVFDIACVLIDEVTEGGGLIVENPDYYTTKAKSLLTLLQTELLTNDQIPEVVTDLEQKLLLPDRVCLSVLPYGLAAHLLIADNDMETASFFNGRYDELKGKVKTLAKTKTITDVYGVSGYGSDE